MFEMVNIGYSYELSVENFLKVERLDNDRLMQCDTLCDRLTKAGCECVEYNGHFGPFVFFSLPGNAHGGKLAEIKEIIEKYIS